MAFLFLCIYLCRCDAKENAGAKNSDAKEKWRIVIYTYILILSLLTAIQQFS